jgi:2-dehydro-3-deoxyglucarate aldolase/4-hydroxy-2-oxoheptanedioate aldolase
MTPEPRGADRIPPGLRRPGAPAFGTWIKLPTLETLELLADAGFEFVVIDLEHSALGLETAYRLIFGAQTLGMAALVRVPDRSGALFQRLLDAGADGILVPQVTTVDQAVAAVRGMTFAPLGDRGMGATSRAGRWGTRPVADYLAAGDHVTRCIQIEDLDALDEAEQLLDVDGLTAVFVGMGDLTLSSQLDAGSERITAAIAHLVATATERGLPCGTAVGTADAAAAAVDRGFSFVMVSNDATMFGHAAAALGRAVRTALRT